jgi:hypothetical protein
MTATATLEAPVRTDETAPTCPHSVQFQWGARSQDTQTVRCGIPIEEHDETGTHMSLRDREGWAAISNVPHILVVASETIIWRA